MPSSFPVPPIYRLSLDHWESIAFHVAAEGKTQGPPSGILSLLRVSRYVHAETCIKNNARLYARLFRLKFDYSAPQRRLSERWMTDRCLASELTKRFAAMRRIRDRSYNFDDLWTCYLMMLENDSKNEVHLLDWANLKQYLVALIIARAHAPPQIVDTDPTMYALATWLMWMTSSRESFKAEHPEFLNHLSRVLQPLLAAGYLHPSSYAPDTCFHLPLCGPEDPGNRCCSGPRPPKAARLVHYSHALTISYPLSVSAAALLWAVQAESRQDEQTFPRFPRPLPTNRQTANEVEWIGPTLEDIIDFHYHVRVSESCSSTTAANPQGCTYPLANAAEKSRRYDEEWSRLVVCHDLTLGNTPLRGPVYQVGSLCGNWAGRFMEPHLDAYMDALLGRRSPHAVPLYQKPLYWTLREHHCLSPDGTLSIGIHESGVDDVLNGWLPRGYNLEEVEGAVLLHDPYTEQPARYETFIPGNAAHYSKGACDKAIKDWISSVEDSKEIAVDENGLVPSAAIFDDTPSTSSIDNDDEYMDHVEYISSGISDILVTGETGSPGDAWGHYKIIGRVRPWDGFVVLLQIPDPTVSHQGQWIFKGYIHDRNFVGRWRETSTTVGAIGLEGCFVMTRRGNI